MYQKAAGVCLAAWLTASIFSGCFFPEYKLLSDDEVTLLQFAPLVSGEELAVVDTTKGSFTMRFFPSEAPQAVENFISLAKEGFYDGKSIYAIAHTEGQQLPVSFVSGSEDGGISGSSIYGNEPFDAEISTNLWPFGGAVAAISNSSGKADSRFFVTAAASVDEEQAKEMRERGFPGKVIEKFQEVGGVPQYSLSYAIFGQVVDGMDVVEQILNTPCDENQIPKEEIYINSVNFINYQGE